MSKIKEYKRNLVILVASHYLGEPEEGDLYDTYLTLLDAPKDDLAMNHIDNTWEQMEYVSVGSLVELIEDGVFNLEITGQDFFQKIDWSELRNQKHGLLQAIIKLENRDAEDPLIDDLHGILHLIDGIQDHAVDNLKIVDAIHVYDFDKEDDRDKS